MNRSLVLLCVAALSCLPANGFADGVDGMDGIAEHSPERASMSERTLGSSPLKFEKASPAKQSIAAGHLARARSLLIAALNEFDAGVAKADPSSLIDTGTFREGIKARAHELDRVLDPQARESETGVKYSADTRLLNQK